MADIGKLENYLRDRSVVFGARFKELINSHGLTFTNKAWLGEVLLESVEEDEKIQYKKTLKHLGYLVKSWRSRGKNNN